MSIIGGLDLHRRQITFDWVDRDSGEAHRGRAPATRTGLRAWLGELHGAEGVFAVEGCTGWRFVVEELQAAGFLAHLAEPAETSSLRGPKRRAKTDRTDKRTWQGPAALAISTAGASSFPGRQPGQVLVATVVLQLVEEGKLTSLPPDPPVPSTLVLETL